MSNTYLNVTIEKKWLTQNFDFKSLILNWILKLLIATKKSEVLEQSCVWLFYYFNFERNYDVSKSNGSCILLNENINFNKSKTETKMENPTHNFRETNPVLQLIKELQIKSKTVISWSSQKKREGIFSNVYFVRMKFFRHLRFISMYSVLNTLSEYRYFYISKSINPYTFLLVFKIVGSPQCIPKTAILKSTSEQLLMCWLFH